MSTQETLSLLVLLESVLLALGFVLTAVGFPGWIKIAIARVKGKQYVVKLTKDNALVFEGAKETEGIYQTKTGAYELEPEDSFTFNGSSGALWYAPYNRAIHARVMPLLHDLKKFEIDNYGHLMYLYNTPVETIRAESGDKAAEMAATLQGYEGKILQSLEVVRIPDLRNFLESRSPASENGIIERYVAIERRKNGNPLTSSNMILMLIMAGLLGLALGYIMGGSSGGESGAISALSTASNSLTQVT